MTFDQYAPAAALLDITTEEASDLDLISVLRAIADGTMTITDAHEQLVERRRLAELLAHPRLTGIERQFGEHGYGYIEWASLAHGEVTGELHSPVHLQPSTDHPGLSADITFDRETLTFHSLADLLHAQAVINDLVACWPRLSPEQTTFGETAAA
jgi:hypothetical protein